jgi:hypothetical protein
MEEINSNGKEMNSMNKFDERESIRLEMDFIKEQGREDFNLYFELRKQRSKRFTELQQRLRELDQLEWERSQQQYQQPKQEPPKERFADLPKEKQVIDYLEKEQKIRTGKVLKSNITSQTISTYLKQQTKPASRNQIKQMLKQELNKEYANITDVLNNAQKQDQNIIKLKEGNKVYYSYQK